MSGRVYQGDNEDLRAEGRLAGRAEMPDAKPFGLPGFNRHMDEVKKTLDHHGEMIGKMSFSNAEVAPGGSTPSLYSLPEGAKELQDLIEHRNMNFAVGNIFKACFRLGQKDGVDASYDLRKVLFFAERELRRVEAMNEKV